MSRPSYCVPINKYKLLYVQLPKCANTSILLSLGKLAEWKGIGHVEKNPHKHHDIQEVARKHKIPVNQDTINRFRDYYKFTFVRNPWDRIISCWKDKVKYKQKRFIGFDPWKIGAGLPFASFAKRISTVSDKDANDHFRSQFYAVSVKGKAFYDWYGKVEQINDDWALLQQLVEKRGGKLDDLLILNQGRDGKGYRQYYDQATRSIISKRYRKDILTFKYKF